MSVNYPKGIGVKKTNSKLQKRTTTQSTIHGNRGMGLEEMINESNQYYLQHNMAVIHKKPTPIQIVKVDYPKRSAAQIKEAYFKNASTTDYNGVFNGFYIDFEAKETRQKTSFPLTNFHAHQVAHMKQCLQQEGIVFIIFRFVSLNRIFLLKATEFINFWDNQYTTGSRKSIPLAYIEKYGFEIQTGVLPVLPYLETIQSMIKSNNKF